VLPHLARDLLADAAQVLTRARDRRGDGVRVGRVDEQYALVLAVDGEADSLVDERDVDGVAAFFELLEREPRERSRRTS